MTKPIGFYTSAMPQDGYLDELQSKYGSTFADMPRTLKAAILMKLAENLLTTEVQLSGTMVALFELAELLPIAANIYKRVTIGEQLGLAEAIVNQLKNANPMKRVVIRTETTDTQADGATSTSVTERVYESANSGLLEAWGS